MLVNPTPTLPTVRSLIIRPSLFNSLLGQAFFRHRIIPRQLVDTNLRDTTTTVFGHKGKESPTQAGFGLTCVQ